MPDWDRDPPGGMTWLITRVYWDLTCGEPSARRPRPTRAQIAQLLSMPEQTGSGNGDLASAWGRLGCLVLRRRRATSAPGPGELVNGEFKTLGRNGASNPPLVLAAHRLAGWRRLEPGSRRPVP